MACKLGPTGKKKKETTALLESPPANASWTKEYNFHMIGLVHKHGRRFIVLVHQHGGRDVMRKQSNCLISNRSFH